MGGAQVMDDHCTDGVAEEATAEIERIHSKWIESEIRGDAARLLELCSDDIELWPPDAPPVVGRSAVSAQLMQGATRIYSIEIAERRIRVSNELAYLTAKYRTTCASAVDAARSIVGSHLWILRRQGCTWFVTLVSWSVWHHAT
jgi:ketosteroid isomerase-like protein